MIESHTIMDGKVHVYRRERSRFWQCAVFLSGRNYRQTTRQDNVAMAIKFAREWYLERLGALARARANLCGRTLPCCGKPNRHAGVAELVDATDLGFGFECAGGNPRRRTAQIRGTLSDGNPEPSPGRVFPGRCRD